MSKTITKFIYGVQVTRPSKRLPLFAHYEGQSEPQPAYMELDGDSKAVYFDYSGEIGNAIPSYVWHNRAIWIGIPCDASCKELDRFVAENADTIRKLLNGYTEDTDCNGNFVGHWDSDLIGKLGQEEEWFFTRY